MHQPPCAGEGTGPSLNRRLRAVVRTGGLMSPLEGWGVFLKNERSSGRLSSALHGWGVLWGWLSQEWGVPKNFETIVPPVSRRSIFVVQRSALSPRGASVIDRTRQSIRGPISPLEDYSYLRMTDQLSGELPGLLRRVCLPSKWLISPTWKRYFIIWVIDLTSEVTGWSKTLSLYNNLFALLQETR